MLIKIDKNKYIEKMSLLLVEKCRQRKKIQNNSKKACLRKAKRLCKKIFNLVNTISKNEYKT